MNEVIAYTDEALEGRFSRVRTEETTLGNFIADLMMTECEADIGLINGGCLRANMVFPKGPLTLKFIDLVMPIPDTVTRLKMKGSLVVNALENGISTYPKYEGRFPCTSGIKFKFDPEKPAGERILMDTLVEAEGNPFDVEKEYTVAIPTFMTLGKDGYTAFLDPSVEKLKAIWGDEPPSMHAVLLAWSKNFRKKPWGIAALAPRVLTRFKRRLQLFGTKISNRDEETGCIKISPKIEGRIVNIRDPITH